MPYSPQEVAAMARDLMRELQRDDPTRAPGPGRQSGIDILSALERDPNLTLDDILGPEPAPPRMPPTLTGRENVEPMEGILPAGAFRPQPLPPNLEGRGLQPQSESERQALRRDAASAGNFAVQGGLAAATPFGGPVLNLAGRGAAAVARPVGEFIGRHAVAYGLAGGGAGAGAVLATPSEANPPQPPAPPTAQQALDRMQTERERLQQQRQTIVDERGRFTDLNTPEKRKAAQERLNALGYNVGTADGNTGPLWRGALERYNADRQREIQDISKQLNDLNPQITDAQKQIRLDQIAAAKEAGGQRLRDIEKNTSIPEKLWREFGPYAGALFGFISGMAGRGKLGKYANQSLENTAQRADALMAPNQRGGVPGRYARANQFWAEGSSGRQTPFTDVPGRRPYPYARNPDAPAASELYHPSFMNRWGPALGIGSAGAIETGLGEGFLVPAARRELEAAQAAVADDPSEANIQRLQTAKNQLAGAETFAYLGRGTLGSVIPGEFKARAGYTPARPNVSAADAERGLLDKLLPVKKQRGGGGSSSGRRGSGPKPDDRLGGSGHRDPATGQIAPRPRR